jgi:ribosomal protein S12 methylthiotransferase
VKYVDMPLQHIDEEMLTLMRRETSRQHIEELIHGLRATIPGIYLRTTFIVGFPGETEKHFESLLGFIDRIRFERLGVFPYSREEGSRAGKMGGQVPAATKNARYRRAMELQQTIASQLANGMIGAEIKALVEQPLVVRGAGDAPEVDTRVLLTSSARVGEFVNVRITGTQGYDLRGDLCS